MTYLKYASFLVLLMSLTMYFFGYVPKTSYPKHDLKNRLFFQKQTIDKVVLIVIDSLRPDMIFEKRSLWPNLMGIINKTWVYSTRANIQPPSMSLAKIKSIITGAVVGFIDVIFNTDSGKIKQDNLIDILKSYRNFVINFYGDITWMKLFPDQFNVRDPTTPFFVRDYFQVDYNVSRNIPNILSNYKLWDMVIMHYLGIDHIGHAEGPFNSAIEEKLSEMDNKTMTLIQALFKKDKTNKTLFILTADHGMSDLGGHGGSSKNEVNVPLLFFNKKFSKMFTWDLDSLSQNDIAPSLSVLLGVPIPADNIGVIPLRILSLIDNPMDQTQALLSNYDQLSKLMGHNSVDIASSFSSINSSIFSIHRNCSFPYLLNCTGNLSNQHKKLINLMKQITEVLKFRFIQHNFVILEIAHFLVILSSLVSFGILLMESGIFISVAGVLFVLSISSMLLTFVYIENLDNCNFTAFKISTSALIFILTCHTLMGAKIFIKKIFPTDFNILSEELVIKLCLMFNLFGSAIPGFIKEENQVWCYLCSTLLLLYLFKEFATKNVLETDAISVVKSTYFATFIILISDRFLRTLNRTGELWSHIPDFGDWLVRKSNTNYLMISIGICLVIVVVIYWDRESILNSFFYILLVVLNGIHRYADIKGLQRISDISVWVFYSIIVFQILFNLTMKKFNQKFKISSIIFFTSFIICRNQNILLWTVIEIKRLFYRKIWLEEIRHLPLIFQYLIFNMIGMVSFFQQGNSNSLTTLDVQPGFVGMTSFVPQIIFPVVAIHTFAGNFYWIFIWIEWLAGDRLKIQYKLVVNQEANLKNSLEKTTDSTAIIPITEPDKPLITSFEQKTHFAIIFNSFTFITSLFLLMIYLFAILHKNQITAWSVYAPKLLYMSFQGGFLLIIYSVVGRLYFL